MACDLPESHSHIKALKNAIDVAYTNSIRDRWIAFLDIAYAQKIISGLAEVKTLPRWTRGGE